MTGDDTFDVGYVHVGDEAASDTAGVWVCASNCPHPDHRPDVAAEDDPVDEARGGRVVSLMESLEQSVAAAKAARARKGD